MSITSADVTQGRLLWLPDEYDIRTILVNRYGGVPPTIHQSLNAIPATAFGHLALVISRPATHPDFIYFLVLTSNDKRTLVDKYPKANNPRRDWNLPIHPTEDHPNNSALTPLPTLFLKNKVPVRGPSYVETNRIFCLPWRIFCEVKKDKVPQHRLAPQSMQTLLTHDCLHSIQGVPQFIEPEKPHSQQLQLKVSKAPRKFAIAIVDPATGLPLTGFPLAVKV